MSPNPTRLQRLMKIIGEENLPPKLKDELPEPIEQSSAPIEPYVVEFASGPDTSKWWDATPPVYAIPPGPKLSTIGKRPDHTATILPRSPKGEPALPDLKFTPFLAVTKFPYKFVGQGWRQPLASAFFDEGKIWSREWDIYYIWSSDYQTPNPVTFIPEHQLLQLVSEINQTFPEADITISDHLRDAGLVIDFEQFRNLPHLRPRYLGCTTSRSQYDSWVTEVAMAKGSGSKPPSTGDRTFEAFRDNMERAIEMGKNKNKALRSKRQAENVTKRQTMAKSLLRAQRYLGLAPVQGEDSLLPNIESMSIQPFNSDASPRHPFDMDVVFIAIDAEAYEREPRCITEVGVATLDTRDLKGTAPGKLGRDWQQFIRARHFRITEYKDYRNSEFVQGCPDKFEFGDSEFVGKDLIGKVLSTCFKPPFSAPKPSESDEKRNVVLLGHDVSQDVAFLRKLGYDVTNFGSLRDTLDTAELYRVYTKDPNARGLGSILLDFEFTGWNLHNAGNDAAYTVWVFLAICVKEISGRGSAEEAQKHQDELEERTAAAVESAKQKVLDDQEGWEVGR